MMDSLVLDKVTRVLSDVLECPLDTISLKTTTDDIEEWDSLNHLNLILALELEFQVRFKPEEIQRMLTVESIVNVVREKIVR